MKMFIILGALALAFPAIAIQDKHYQYKDISPETARQFPVTTKNKDSQSQLKSARHKVRHDLDRQKQEDRPENVEKIK